MKSLTEVARDLNAIKEERSHPRIAVPNQVQADENLDLVTELLAGTGIDQGQLAGLAMEVAASGLDSVAAVDGGIDGAELMSVLASIWVDGVVLGARYVAAIRLSDSQEPVDGQNGPDPGEAAPAADSVRTAAQDDPRGERDR